MKHRHYHFQGRTAFFGVHAGRNTAAVIGDLYRIVLVDFYRNQAAVPGKGFINGVVHHFPDEVVQTFESDVADVHGRALPHGFQTFQYLNIVC